MLNVNGNEDLSRTALLFLSIVSFLASYQVLMVHIVVFPCDVTKTVVYGASNPYLSKIGILAIK